METRHTPTGLDCLITAIVATVALTLVKVTIAEAEAPTFQQPPGLYALQQQMNAPPLCLQRQTTVHRLSTMPHRLKEMAGEVNRSL